MLPENILFSSDPGKDLQGFLQGKQYTKIVVLTDTNTQTHSYPLVKNFIPAHSVITIPSGEEYKTIETCIRIWKAMTDQALDRHALVIVLGGGVLGDMGGFCAATYKRGIDFILIPTTLLAQADASIGGKLGIDFEDFKNHIGVFQQPVLTLIFSGFLKTLPFDELRSGFAEVIKHVLISDKALWPEISSKNLADQLWERLVRHSVDFKARVTQEDPKEKGLRKILNAGHTIGHALESYFISSKRRILHGEAIAVGLIAEGYIAFQKGLLAQAELDDMVAFILKIYGKVDLTTDQIEAIAGLAIQDKKNKGNRILCVLQQGIGNAQWDVEISVDEIKGALSFYHSQT